MTQPRLLPVDRPDVAPLSISPRLRGQLVYFITPAGSAGVHRLEENEFWIARDDVVKWLDEGSSTSYRPSTRPTRPRSN
jgi:hypothetical protein